MNKRLRFAILGLLVLTVCASNVLAIGRVAKRWYVFDMYGGYSQPVGSYDHISIIDFGRDLDADQIYDNGYHLGFSLGRMVSNRFVTTIGFVYTKIEPLDRYWITPTEYTEFDPFTPKFGQYDVTFSGAYHFLPLEQAGFTPFAGASGKLGLTRQYLSGYETEYEFNGAVALLFGVDVKLWQGKNQSMLALTSTNSYDLIGSGYRPRYLNLGVGLRWYLRP